MRKMVKAKWVVKIPVESKIMVSKGAEVEEGDILLKSSIGKVVNIDVAKYFSKMSKEEIEEVEKSMVGRIWETGEEMWKGGSFLKKKKLLAPGKGKVLGMDEFGNILFGLLDEEIVIKSPVKAKFIKEEEEKLFLEFKAREYKGEAKVMGKTWGKMKSRVIGRLFDLDKDCEGAIIRVEGVDSYFWRKAEAVGVKGILVKQGLEIEVGTELPVMELNDFEWEALGGEMEDKDEVRALLNSKAGRLLLVLE